MNLKTVRATLAIGGALMLLIALAGWFALIGPATGRIGEVRLETVDVQDANSMLSVQLIGLQKQADDLGRTRKAERELSVWWPATADQPGFFATVSAAARDAGYAGRDLTTLSPTAPVAVETLSDPTAVAPETSRFYVQNVVLTAEGSFSEAEDLLRRLERLPRGLLITSVSVTASSEAPGAVSLSVTGATFVAPPPQDPNDPVPEDTTDTPDTTDAPAGATTDAAVDPAAGVPATTG